MNNTIPSDNLLADILAIQECKSRFLYCLDDVINFGHDGETSVIGLLCQDAQLTMGDLPTVYGSRAIYTGLVSALTAEGYTYMSHMVSNPVIDVAGSAAKGRWYVYCVIKKSHEPGKGYTWLHASYEDTFRRENGQWRLASIKAHTVHQPV